MYDDNNGGGADSVPDIDDLSYQHFDNYLNSMVQHQKSAKVKRCKVNKHGNRMCKSHSNPILDTIIYDVDFPDGTEKEFAANIIAQNMYSQCYVDGNQYLLMEGIVYHKKDQTAVE